MSLVILEYIGDSAKASWITNWIVTFTLLDISDAHSKQITVVGCMWNCCILL